MHIIYKTEDIYDTETRTWHTAHAHLSHEVFHLVFNTQHSTDHYTVLRSTHLTVYHGMTPQR